MGIIHKYQLAIWTVIMTAERIWRIERPIKRLILLTLLIILLTMAFLYYFHPMQLINHFKHTYGPTHYSQHYEEYFIRDFFKDKRGGIFVDVGANDYKVNSTTYYLEKYLGWHGIAVDANNAFKAGYLAHRPKTKYITAFISDHSGLSRDFYIVKTNSRLSTGDKESVSRFPLSKVSTQTLSLNDLLGREGVHRIDFLSIDIELSESKALKGFDIERYKPWLVCIEAHEKVKPFILAYFKSHQYVEIKHYSKLDPLNLYFTPAS